MKTKRILLVDDHEGLRGVFGTILRTSGFEVIEAENGAVAKALLERNDHGIDLILTDTEMPKMDGLELVKWVKEVNPGLPVIISTGSMDIDLLSGVESSGADKFLPKPYTSQELLRVVAGFATAA